MGLLVCGNTSWKPLATYWLVTFAILRVALLIAPCSPVDAAMTAASIEAFAGRLVFRGVVVEFTVAFRVILGVAAKTGIA
jgi:hypothetical protein